MVTYEDFKKTVYYTRLHVVVPLLKMRLDKIEFFKKDKFQLDLVDKKLYELYNENIDKFK